MKITFKLVLLGNLLMRGAAADEIHLVHLGQAGHGSADRVGQSEVHLGLSTVGLSDPGPSTWSTAKKNVKKTNLSLPTSVFAAAFSHLSLIYFGTLTNHTPLALLARSSSLSAFDLVFSFGIPFEVEAILNFENNPGQN